MTKNFYIVAILILFIIKVNAQSDTIQANIPTGVEKSIFNIQTGILGLWGSNEARLGRNFALRTELGMDTYVSEDIFTGNSNKIVQIRPTINIEPRWYYNFDKRALKGGNTANNGVNFLSLAVNYLPDWFKISNNQNYQISNDVLIVARWVLRRNIGKSNFNYEVGTGFGHRFRFTNRYGYSNTSYDSYLDVYTRIGYTFK